MKSGLVSLVTFSVFAGLARGAFGAQEPSVPAHFSDRASSPDTRGGQQERVQTRFVRLPEHANDVAIRTLLEARSGKAGAAHGSAHSTGSIPPKGEASTKPSKPSTQSTYTPSQDVLDQHRHLFGNGKLSGIPNEVGKTILKPGRKPPKSLPTKANPNPSN
ncbi:hypothetical protein OC834_006553 [Tilletia horrida]|uniref:Uncharacterized protein n=1 Tax=Tilletia horrida TaxID=155126 RepID=A0AAN6JHR8_9BASI|nr:hypothetical protein OC834_006553 [Tilletia horrida]KAK0521860.1 hypothetical protein OC842_006645 [Tilletia horrida]KAK0556262.1 hypothetical protein OC844_005895 [Tilletia horrida]